MAGACGEDLCRSNYLHVWFELRNKKHIMKISNVKTQMSIQIKMTKCQIWTLNFDIDLSFGFGFLIFNRFNSLDIVYQR
jgi:hypothetical protein